MRITLIAEEVGSPTSGQSRFLINLATGLRDAKVEVGVAASMIRPEVQNQLERIGVSVKSLRKYRDRSASKLLLLTTRSHVGRDVATAARIDLPADWYVVVADAAIDASASLPSDSSVYLSNGDLGLMLLNEAFFQSHSLAKSILSWGLSNLVRLHASFAAKYRVLLGNSEFTRGFMSYLYSTPFTGVVYPPVDLRFFRPSAPKEGGSRFVVSVARNSNEQGIKLLESAARRFPLHVIGGASVRGAQNLDVISDESLRLEYGQAAFLLFPIVSEFFGYAVAESLACGTPVLAYCTGGPSELIQNGVNGWLVTTTGEALDLASSLFREGVTTGMRSAARQSAERFSTDASAMALLSALPK
jgi:glycosyltransferase involved in cell wall biosynthesis